MKSRANFFTSGWDIKEVDDDLIGRFQMINIAIILSSIGLVFGIFSNIIKDISGLIPIELFLLGMNFILFMLLRYKKESLRIVSLIETGQFTFLFLFLVYVSEPNQMKYVWIFTYPIILLYFQNENSSIYWVCFMVIGLVLAPFQPFVEVSYTLFQLIYISVVLIIISVIISFYQKKMDEARDLIKSQVDELTRKDRLLSLQSKQAVMDEMISMIAHQWRQPLSTVTLSISDLQVKKMLGKKIDDVMDKALQDISDTIVYLSETIDDFQTYFAANKKLSEEKVAEIVERAINFTKARVEGSGMTLEFEEYYDVTIQTYSNEIVQMILNIINNAIDELVENKRSGAKITIKVKDAGDNCLIIIEDNGRGIPKENIESIFEPYFSTKGKNGTGLGLYMSEMIMEKQFDSKIEVSSSLQGTKFQIRVPKKLI